MIIDGAIGMFKRISRDDWATIIDGILFAVLLKYVGIQIDDWRWWMLGFANIIRLVVVRKLVTHDLVVTYRQEIEQIKQLLHR